MRLNRFLAACGLGSRRGCEQLIRDGQIEINGGVCTNLATQVGPDDTVLCDGKRACPPGTLTIAFHKPRGVLCTRSDELGRKTLYNLLPHEMQNLHYVGRLDKESEGLLVLTNDGDLTNRLTHPRHKIEKEYSVTLERPFDRRDATRLRQGVVTTEGIGRVESVEIESPRILNIVLTQGLKRQIRLMLGELGYPVKRLVRTRVGNLQLDGLAVGKWRRLRESDWAN